MTPSDLDQHFFMVMFMMVFAYAKLRKDETKWQR